MPTSTISAKLVVQILAVVVVVVTFLIGSYIYTNQPTCPQCENAEHLLYTWKSFQDSETTKHEFKRLGPFGYCTHYQPPIALQQPASHFSWFCVKCN
ncbi:MAG: hypothetical protein SGJ27_23990 [Candidatus Melainabacteria bacterium]|nr:hypothetical protein [Candidatus Melainabacteria bacterium]